MKIKKIDDSPEPQAVDDIADRAADNQADRDGEKARSGAVQPENQPQHDPPGEQRKHQGIEAGLVEQAKTDAAVAGQHEIEKRRYADAVAGAASLAEKPEHRR